EKSPFSQRQRYKAISIPPRKECNRINTRISPLAVEPIHGKSPSIGERKNTDSRDQRTKITLGENWHFRRYWIRANLRNTFRPCSPPSLEGNFGCKPLEHCVTT